MYANVCAVGKCTSPQQRTGLVFSVNSFGYFGFAIASYLCREDSMKKRPGVIVRTVALSAFATICLSSAAQTRLQTLGRTGPSVSSASLQTSGQQLVSSPSGPALPSFRVGGGDVLSILVWKEKDFSPTVTVRPDGRITMPVVGEVQVTGLTPIQIEELLRRQLETVIVDPQVTVTVVEVHSMMVYITGEVMRPGAYPLNTPLTVLQLIAQAGGFAEFASRKNIALVHPGVSSGAPHRSVTYSYKEMLHSEVPEHNPQLEPGDTVIVP